MEILTYLGDWATDKRISIDIREDSPMLDAILQDARRMYDIAVLNKDYQMMAEMAKALAELAEAKAFFCERDSIKEEAKEETHD